MLINSLVNPTHRLLDTNYVPHLTYVEPPSNGYWNIPISLNSKYFPVFEPLDIHLPDARRLPMEFECLSLFHTNHGSECEKIWSNDRLESVKNFKVIEFMKTNFFEYTLNRRGVDYIHAQADFV